MMVILYFKFGKKCVTRKAFSYSSTKGGDVCSHPKRLRIKPPQDKLDHYALLDYV